MDQKIKSIDNRKQTDTKTLKDKGGDNTRKLNILGSKNGAIGDVKSKTSHLSDFSNRTSKTTRSKINSTKKTDVINRGIGDESDSKIKPDDKDVRSDVEARKRVQDRLNLNRRNVDNSCKKDDVKWRSGSPRLKYGDRFKKSRGDTVQKEKEKSEEIKNAEESKIDEEKKREGKESERKGSQKKPYIRTFTNKNDSTKVYKAVTFTEQTQKGKLLNINIPMDTATAKKTKIPKLIPIDLRMKIEPSTSSVQEKSVTSRKNRNIDHKIKRQNRPILSPVSDIKDGGSPPTEVAKWAPNCINRHTKPYYEAWISTTLAAISRNSEEDKLFLQNKKFIETFQRAIDRSDSPELVYENCKDERYTGRIKINHR